MPKQKTRKSAAKRFKVTKRGKILRGRAFTSHLNVKRSSKKRRAQGRPVEVKGFYAKKLRKGMGLRKASSGKS
ncbi:50S ribosomal protein L35 [Candidatus Woesebacteria bacterium RIFCSPLOWO2_01_FULL_44_24b]|nr:MAG: 50S ribosomal protein L35 [Candidatus Woesebacteria bacterium RIFCSPLOWO2_01_FULL_44_24b]